MNTTRPLTGVDTVENPQPEDPEPEPSVVQFIKCGTCKSIIGHDEKRGPYTWHITREGHEMLSGRLRCEICGNHTFVPFLVKRRHIPHIKNN